MSTNTTTSSQPGDTVADLASSLMKQPSRHGTTADGAAGESSGDSSSSSRSAALARGMSHTGSWEPVLDRRQSWDAQEYKHDLLKRQYMDGEGTAPGSMGGFSEA
ncbi:hypothetical protein MYCTH_2310408 [Thermothelomyces thermophilus ATCC 42464]|uniref:Uncharacterized protein n=1 Tax=Thermothelomyces thermophilus (strain ATCC 42464 / BCRC 31852 / DSM 1799) TaxID=573729 RepID=G2QLH0_THET4|nr:uncharacterized protein MYCTH_2310408 [Thermothelomyces thermophilus ATCC 42464]AEO60801.1 hypothetical protein MYCTH_2310408 [Thermothelomyces thermophilus ATCC 42464]